MTDRQADVQAAKDLLGAKEADIKKIWQKFASGWDGAWCSETACAISYLGGNLDLIPGASNYAAGLVQKFKSAGMFGHNPAVGAFIFFDYHDGAGASHTGRVIEVTDQFIYTIEGNVNSKVVQKSYAKTNGYIYGYGYPRYKDGEMKFGIDISFAQGDFDLAGAVKNHGIEFAIIKAGENSGTEMFLDPQFKANYQKAKALGLPIGAYWYSKAINKAQAIAEADWLIEHLGKMQFELPIYIDFEDNVHANLSATQSQAIVLAWLERMYSVYWYAGVYTMYSWFVTKLQSEKIGRYPLWIAFWADGKPSYKYDYGMWQSGTRQINGNPVDSDHLYNDYTTQIIAGGFNNMAEAKTYSDVNYNTNGGRAIKYCTEKGYMMGYTDGTFDPKGAVTREQLAIVIERLAKDLEA